MLRGSATTRNGHPKQAKAEPNQFSPTNKAYSDAVHKVQACLQYVAASPHDLFQTAGSQPWTKQLGESRDTRTISIALACSSLDGFIYSRSHRGNGVIGAASVTLSLGGREAMEWVSSQDLEYNIQTR